MFKKAFIILIIIINFIFLSILLIGYYFSTGSDYSNKETESFYQYNSNIEVELDYLPSSLEREIKKDCRITLVEMTESGYAGKYYILSSNIEIDPNNITYATLHEIGHYVDYKYNYSQSEEFLKIYEEEKYYLGEYFQESEREFFAECFKLYWKDGLSSYLLDKGYFIIPIEGPQKVGLNLVDDYFNNLYN